MNRTQFPAMTRDETGAESAEIILVLVILIIGLYVAFAYLYTKLNNRLIDVNECIDSADEGVFCE